METGREKRDGKGGRGHSHLYLHSNSSQVNGIFFRTRIVATENMPVCLGEREREGKRGEGGIGEKRERGGRYLSIFPLRSKIQLASFPGHTLPQIQYWE